MQSQAGGVYNVLIELDTEEAWDYTIIESQIFFFLLFFRLTYVSAMFNLRNVLSGFNLTLLQFSKNCAQQDNSCSKFRL